MDSFLVDYLKSGQAWVLVGSGPSIEMGYPSWEKLATIAYEAARIEAAARGVGAIEAALRRKDFPKVFEDTQVILGGPRLLQVLQGGLTSTCTGEIYKLIARWPVPVYLTTNYDDEIQHHLAALGEAYIPYSNSEDHLSYLLPGLSGAIFKLHGDLRSETGLILTSTQYKDIAEMPNWVYWRTKMTSVFQMNRVVVIGHSLSDKNIKHILEAAKRGAGVLQPICWIAPDVPTQQAKEFLEKYRIRVISYDNRDGEHRNLVRLVETVSQFIPPRTTVHIQDQIAKLFQPALGNNAAAPGFFVFNKLAAQSDYDEKRIDVMLAAIQSAVPALASMGQFALKTALEASGWPKELPLPLDLATSISSRAVQQGLLTRVGDQFTVGDKATMLAAENKERFEHMRERFKTSLQLRAKQAFPALSNQDAAQISGDIESSLTGFFKEGGLSLASTLFSTQHRREQTPIPSSIIKFITEASTRYEDLLKRQAFASVSVDAFVHAGSAERDYLGRVSQGFFAFHSLGTFGDVAIERLKQAKNTVWLIDSSAQIPALALGAPTNPAFVDCFSRLHAAGIRLFTTEKLFSETREHLWFANDVVKRNGPDSTAVLAAAKGEPPYRKSNLFLEGFIRWQSAGNPCNWENYNFQMFGTRSPKAIDIKSVLLKLGVEVIHFQDWPGFEEPDYGICQEYAEKIIQKKGNQSVALDGGDINQPNPHKKAEPEAEAFVIVRKEREGLYHVLAEVGEHSPSWFISQTSILNALEEGSRVTWQPEAFLRFASTLSSVANPQSTDRAFEALLWGLAQSGLSLLDEDTVMRAFGAPIDHATLDIAEQRQLYHATIEQKYGEPLEAVLARVSPSYRPLAAIQIANEMAQAAAQQRQIAEARALREAKRAELAEKQLRAVEKFRRKMEAKQHRRRKRRK